MRSANKENGVRRSPSSRQRSFRDGDLDAVSRRLDELAGRLDALSLDHGPDTLGHHETPDPSSTPLDAASMGDAARMGAILDTLDVIDQWISAARRPEPSQPDGDLHRAVGEIVRRQAALESGPEPGPAEEAQPINPSRPTTMDHQIAELSKELGALRAELGVHTRMHEAGTGRPYDLLRAEIGELRQHIVDRLDEFGQLSADTRLLTSIGDALSHIRNKLSFLPSSEVLISTNGRLAELLNRVDPASLAPARPDLGQLEKQIGRLAEILGTHGPTNVEPDLDSSLRHLGDRLDSIWAVVGGDHFVADRVEQQPPETINSDAIDHLTTQIGELRAQITQLSAPSESPDVDRRLDEILARLENPPAGHAVVDALNSIDDRIARLSKVDGEHTQGAPAPSELLQRHFGELAKRLDTIGQDGARGTADLHTELARLHQASQMSAERRQSDQLSLTSTLQTIVSHLQGVSGGGPVISDPDDGPARPHGTDYYEDHLPLEPGSDRPPPAGDSFRPPAGPSSTQDDDQYQELDPQARRAAFIAAARRAARAASGHAREPAETRKAERLSWFRRTLARNRKSSPTAADDGGVGVGEPLPAPVEYGQRIASELQAAESPQSSEPSADARPLDEIDEQPKKQRYRRSFLFASTIIVSVAGFLTVNGLLNNPDAPTLSMRATDKPAATPIEPQRPKKSARGAIGTVAFEPISVESLTADSGQVTTWTANLRQPTAAKPRAQVNTAPPPEAIGSSELRAAAAAGDRLAQFEVASRFTVDTYVPRNFKAAAAWFQLAADQHLAPAQYRLGSLYEKGKGIERDIDLARIWYTRAAELGNAKAMHNLAVLHAEGKIGLPDFASAAKWFLRAAERGVRDSQYNLGILHARGLGVPRDSTISYKWFAIAAKQEDRDAARKRDEIAVTLSRRSLATVGSAVDAWSPTATVEGANTVPPTTARWSALGDKTGGLSQPLQLISKAQSMLNRQGFDAGPSDGVIGPKTRDAVKAYQRSRGLPQTGIIDRDLIEVLAGRTT
jgi:localization factor PodJL